MPCAARRHRTPLEALADSGEGEAVIFLAGAYLVTTPEEADDLAVAGVPFARVARRPDGGCVTEILLIPVGDDG